MANEFKIKNGLYVSGSTTITDNTTISGSLVIVGGITGSLLGTASYAVNANSTSASFAVTSASLSIRVTDLESTASVLTLASASFAETSASLSIRTTNLESTASVLTTASASFSVVSASYSSASSSLSTRVTNLEATSSTVSSSFAATSGSIAGRVTTIESKYATTGSNQFTGTQYISQASNAISFTSTASLYTDGGLRVQKDFYVSGNAYFKNVTVYGTSSIEYITSSNLNISDNIISVNTYTPAVRFGGLAVYDSGSTGSTGSILWDSEKDRWVYSNPSGSSYDGGMLISGPRNTTGLGNEVGTTACAVMIGQGGDHITSSGIFSYGNFTCFYGNTVISASGDACFASSIQGTTLYGSTTVCGTTICSSGNACFGSTVIMAGNVGIGTSSPSAVLTVAENASFVGFRIQGRSSDNLGRMDFVQSDGTTVIGRIQSVENSCDMRIRSQGQLFLTTGGANTRLTIASTGAACFACELTAKSLGTNDLILNNLNHEHANYVDGTRGSWLIQEGACDLFIINQVTCKKYKFNLIEIK
jgi:hypothetical protein